MNLTAVIPPRPQPHPYDHDSYDNFTFLRGTLGAHPGKFVAIVSVGVIIGIIYGNLRKTDPFTFAGLGGLIGIVVALLVA